jgi:archaeosine-15-forming tRNA-guanine transglycosylase
MAINPMPAPIQYGPQPQDPAQALLQGLQIGGAIRNMRQQRRQEEEAARMKEQFSADMQSYLANPTAAGSRDLILKYPQMREVVAENWSSLSKEMQDEEFKFATNVSMALRSNPEVAARLIEQRRDAFANAGMDTSSLDTMLETAKNNPNSLPFMANLYGASIDPKRWGEYVKATGGEETQKYDLLTPEQKTNLGLDPTKAYQKSTTTGKISQVGGGGTTVNVGAGEGAFEKETGKAMAKQFQGLVDLGVKARRNMQDIMQLEQSLAAVPAGATGKIVAFASNLGIDVPGGDDAAAAEALIERMVPAQREPGTGTMTEGDAKMYRAALPKLLQTPGGRQKIIDTMLATAKYDADMGDIAARAQSGEITVVEARKQMAALGNPLQEAVAFANQVTVNTPQGQIKFPNQAAADAFKKATGLQ